MFKMFKMFKINFMKQMADEMSQYLAKSRIKCNHIFYSENLSIMLVQIDRLSNVDKILILLTKGENNVYNFDSKSNYGKLQMVYGMYTMFDRDEMSLVYTEPHLYLLLKSKIIDKIWALAKEFSQFSGCGLSKYCKLASELGGKIRYHLRNGKLSDCYNCRSYENSYLFYPLVNELPIFFSH